MLHSFRPMAVTCALLTTIALHAASYLTVTDSDGSKTSFELSQKPAISFTYNSLRLVASEQTIDYPLTEYRSFTLTDDNETTGISATKQLKASPLFSFGNTLRGSGLEPNSTVALYSISGQLLKQSRVSANGTVSIPLEGLKGVVVVKAANKSFKFIKK